VRVAVLGGGGMLGHKLFQTLGRRFPETWCTLRGTRGAAGLDRIGAPADRVAEGIDAADWPALGAWLAALRPAVVVNCVGVIKQRATAANAVAAIDINALLPHRLAQACAEWGGRVIHFSTDCVFSGRRGMYAEGDPTDAVDLYGRSKALGEVDAPNALTLRTSIIGRELRHHASLLDWFLAHPGPTVPGYTRAWWSGVTTNHLADVVADLVERGAALSGVYQLSSGRISKHDLLVLLQGAYGRDVEIVADPGECCDRSLCGDRFAAAAGYRFPGWPALLEQLVSDPTPYPVPNAVTS